MSSSPQKPFSFTNARNDELPQLSIHKVCSKGSTKGQQHFYFSILFKKSFHCSNTQFVVINLCSASEEKYQIKPLPCLTFTQKETEFLGSDITNTLPANTIIFQMRISQFVKHMKSQCRKKKRIVLKDVADCDELLIITTFHFKGSNKLMLPSLCVFSRLRFNFE